MKTNEKLTTSTICKHIVKQFVTVILIIIFSFQNFDSHNKNGGVRI